MFNNKITMANCGKSNGNGNLELNDDDNRKKIVAREMNNFVVVLLKIVSKRLSETT